MDADFTAKVVRKAYGAIAKREQSGCGCGCNCGPGSADYAKGLGYSEGELGQIPAEANLALSCGNPTALAGLKLGEVVLDLGSGAGFDCFLAASRVGPNGRVIGVDMTPEMIDRAREIAARDGFGNVEFRLGEIEHLPVADNSVDVIISNCVINLAADKSQVFREMYRVLKPGGRVAISDVALLQDLPPKVKSSIEAYVGCVAGAIRIEEYERLLAEAGLKNVKVKTSGNAFGSDLNPEDPAVKAVLDSLDEGQSITDLAASVNVEAVKR